MLYRGSKLDTHTNQFLHISSFLFFLRVFIGISVRPRPHVAGYFRKRIIFFSEYGYHPHEAGVFGDRKRRFSNALSRVEIFENGNLSYSCARPNTEGFKYDDIMPRFQACSSTHTIRKRNEYGCFYSKIRRKKISVFENTQLRVDGV